MSKLTEMSTAKLRFLFWSLFTVMFLVCTVVPILPPHIAEYSGPAERPISDGRPSGMVWLSAQQPVNLTRVNGTVPVYDPCLDPGKVQAISVVASTPATTPVQVVAISGMLRVYLCSAKIQGTATGTVTLRFGTGTNPNECATFPTDLDTTSIVANGDGALIGSAGAGTFARSAAGQALCFARGASMALYGHVRYVQE